MSRRPEVKELLEELSDVSDWEDIATYLPGVSQADIDGIKKQKGKPTEQKRELFAMWLRRCPTASWYDVREALNKVKLLTLEEDITKKYNLATPKRETEEADGVCRATEQERLKQQESDKDGPVDIN